MKKRNIVRNLLMVALLLGGIFVAGAENRTFAQTGDDTGALGSGCCSSSSASMSGGGSLGSGTLTANGGFISGGSIAREQAGNEESDEGVFGFILRIFF